MKLNILGQDYDVLLRNLEDSEDLNEESAGVINYISKTITINNEMIDKVDLTEEEKVVFMNETLRHEVVHAFFEESGLTDYCNDEVLVEWIAKQFPKMNKAINEFESKQDTLYN